MFERIEYKVERIDGDYAYLKNESEPDNELKCVARALLPEEISEGFFQQSCMRWYSRAE